MRNLLSRLIFLHLGNAIKIEYNTTYDRFFSRSISSSIVHDGMGEGKSEDFELRER